MNANFPFKTLRRFVVEITAKFSSRHSITSTCKFSGTNRNRTFCENLQFRSFSQNFYRYALSACGISLFSYGLYTLYDKNRSKFFIQAAQIVEPKEKIESGGSNAKKIRTTMNFIADIVEKVTPAVVFIEKVGSERTFFGRALSVSHGSGFIVKPDGLILTNLHVVQGSHQLKITLQDGRKFDGFVEHYDASTDLATVRIKAKNLPSLKLAKSKEARAGEFVIAVGSPLTLNNSVSLGVISNTQRELSQFETPNVHRNSFGKKRQQRYIQTDAPITFGNSGGPLINLDGEVVGINNMTLAGAPGISFAIPSDDAAEFLDKLEKKASKQTYLPIFKRRHLGASLLTLDAEVIMALRFTMLCPDVDHGCLVHTVEWGSAAHKSGLQPGDIITHVNQEPLFSSEQLLEMLQKENGNVLKLRILRNWNEENLDVVLDS